MADAFAQIITSALQATIREEMEKIRQSIKECQLQQGEAIAKFMQEQRKKCLDAVTPRVEAVVNGAGSLPYEPSV